MVNAWAAVRLEELLRVLPSGSRLAVVVHGYLYGSNALVHPATIRLLTRVLLHETPESKVDLPADVFEACERAFIEHRVLRLSYVDARGLTTERRVEVHGLVLRRSGLTLSTIDRELGESRTFIVHRIREAVMETERFEPRDPRAL